MDGEDRRLITKEAKTAYYSFDGEIDAASANRIAGALIACANTGFDECYLCLSSPGGTVANGTFLHNFIRGLPIPVIMHNIGQVSSVAVTVFLAADERYCSSRSIFMIHPVISPVADTMSAFQQQGRQYTTVANDQLTEKILRERAAIPDELLSERLFSRE